MTFNISSPIDVMALIILLAVSIKVIVILAKPNAWFNLTTKIWSKPKIIIGVSLILAAYTLFLLVNNGVTIVEIFATMLFFSLLVAIGIATYSDKLMVLAQGLMQDKTIVKKSWLYITIWIILIIWGFYALFA